MTRDKALEHKIFKLSNLPISGLRVHWRKLFRRSPPPAFGPDLLRRSIAHRLQERMYGGLSASIRRELHLIVKSTASEPNGRLFLPRKIKSGSVLIREWKGSTHRVIVHEDGGFLYAGQKYQNLSEIAREITGTRWNGPRFFGLRAPNGEPSEPKRKGSGKKLP